MKRVLLSVAAVALGLTFVAAAEAGPKGGPKGGGTPHLSNYQAGNGHGANVQNKSFQGKSFQNYHLSHGTKFTGGYCYKGKDHCHWSYKCWYGRYGCECYYCPSTCGWYYWYERDCCYYPVSYLPTCTPAPCAAPVGYAAPAPYVAPVSYAPGVTQVVNVTNNSPGSGAPAGPGPAAPMPPSPPGQ